jgi:hypothetical protein
MNGGIAVEAAAAVEVEAVTTILDADTLRRKRAASTLSWEQAAERS